MTALIPRHVSEDESDRRSIKSGWCTVAKRGALTSGPFASLQDCEHEIARLTRAALKTSASRQIRKGSFEAPRSWLAKRVQVVPAAKLTWAGPYWITE